MEDRNTKLDQMVVEIDRLLSERDKAEGRSAPYNGVFTPEMGLESIKRALLLEDASTKK